MFENHGFMAVINDDITGTVLGIGMLLGGVLNGLLGAVLSSIFFAGDAQVLAIMVVFGFLIGLFLCAQIMEVLESGITTLFVSFVMDPHALERQSPFLYSEFKTRYGASCQGLF